MTDESLFCIQTVGELRDALLAFPADMPVVILEPIGGDFYCIGIDAGEVNGKMALEVGIGTEVFE